MDQWFTTRVDRTWNVLDLKIWLLSKALPTPVLPLPASYRPSSPVTFAAAPAPPPRPSTATSYHPPTPATEISSSSALVPPQASDSPISPIAFATAPDPSSRPLTSTSHDAPQTHVFYPPLSSMADKPSRPMSSASPASSVRFSLDEDVPLYANSYGVMLDDYFEDENDEDEDDNQVVGIAPTSIPYSYSTGTPSISGLAALKPNSDKIISGRGYSGSHSNVDADLVPRATAIARRCHVYSFSTVRNCSYSRVCSYKTIFHWESTISARTSYLRSIVPAPTYRYLERFFQVPIHTPPRPTMMVPSCLPLPPKLLVLILRHDAKLLCSSLHSDSTIIS